jgi:aminomethyltransferase
MKRTPLYQLHVDAGAKMVPFAGFEMPVEYSGITSEHMAVRQLAGLFDVSHMGEFWVKGPGALSFLQRVTSNDVSLLKPGKIQYACFPNGTGGIVDDLLVYHYEPEKYMLVVNASNIEKDWQWCMKHKPSDVVLEDASDRISLLAIQGPKAEKILQILTPVDLSALPYYSFTTGEVAGIDSVIISRTGYTGAGGFELFVDNKYAQKMWRIIMSEGNPEGLLPAGLGARDTLRLEMGFCLYGNDIDDFTSPIEAGLGWITKLKPEKNLIDKETLQIQKENGVTRKLVGFKLLERGIPRHGYELVNRDGDVIGNVTSGTMSPVLKQGIGLGYVKTDDAKVETQIFVRIRQKAVPAKIVKLPFV